MFLKMRLVGCTFSFKDAYEVRTMVEEKSRDVKETSTMIGRDFCLGLRGALARPEWSETLLCFDGAIKNLNQDKPKWGGSFFWREKACTL